MKHTAEINTLDLRRALVPIKRVIEKRNTIPILGYMRLDFDADTSRLSILSTDLDIEVNVSIYAKTKTSFSFTMEPKSLSQFLIGESGDLFVTYDDEADKLSWSCSDCTLENTQLLPVDDYPMFSIKPSRKKCKIPQDKVIEIIKNVAPCISTEETRYYLNGAYFHSENDKLVIAATDGHRLAKYTSDIDYSFDGKIIPTKVLKLIKSLVKSGSNEPVKFQFDSVKGRAQIGDTILSFKCIDGSYPDFNRVFPERSDKISIDLSQSQIEKFSTDQRSRAITLSADDGFMQTRDLNNNVIRVPIEGHGEAFGFNLSYLKAFLDISPEINIQGKCSSDPFYINPECTDCQYILMPMKV